MMLPSLDQPKPHSQAYPKRMAFSICLMMRDAERREALRAYLRDKLGNDRGLLISRSGYTKGRISQLLDEDGAFGERAASALARRLGLPVDFFDRQRGPSAPAPSDSQVTDDAPLLYRWRRMTPEQQQELLDQMDQLIKQNDVAWKQLKAMGYDKFVPDHEVAQKLPAIPAQRVLPIPAVAGQPKSRRKK